jgi:tetratricopeptide (TPR) repeat protein
MEEIVMQSRTLQLALRVLTAGLLLTALIVVQGCDTESDDIPTGPAVTVDRLISMGWEYLNDGEVGDALSTFAEAANADASNLEAYLGLGYAFARSQEPISAQRNLSNVLSLGGVLLADGELDQASADTLFAEACAGRASVALSTQDYQMAIDEAKAAQMYWASFTVPKHRWLPEFSFELVMELETRAWYGQGEYGEVMLLLDELSAETFIADLIADGTIIYVSDEVVEVTLLEETEHNGVAQLELTNINLIYPESVMKDGIEYEVVSYDITGNEVDFLANPIPVVGDEYTISYYYTEDFGQFLIALQERLNE